MREHAPDAGMSLYGSAGSRKLRPDHAVLPMQTVELHPLTAALTTSMYCQDESAGRMLRLLSCRSEPSSLSIARREM